MLIFGKAGWKVYINSVFCNVFIKLKLFQSKKEENICTGEKKDLKNERSHCRVGLSFEGLVGVSFGHIEFWFTRSLK